MGGFPRIALSSAMILSAIGAGYGQEVSAPAGIDLAMETFTYNGDSGWVEITGLRLTQGDLQLEADEASASSLEFDESEWRLSGNVRVTLDSAHIESNEALFMFKDKQLTVLELRGDPATFEDLGPDQEETARGSANRLYYNAVEGTLSLTDDAWLRLGEVEAMGCDLVYDFDEENYTSGSADCSQPFTIRIPPAEGTPAEDTAAAGDSPQPP